jgi:1-acyl-sn-glycerol-3-phosphate acyltransferase
MRRESVNLRTTIGRRWLTIPVYVSAWCLCVVTAPLWLPVTAIVDVIRRDRGVALRSAVFLTYYLSCEVLGIAISAGFLAWKSVFPVDAERWADLHYRLEAWWGTALLRGVVRVFGLRLEVEGDADLARGPYLMLVRHTSSCDTLLASALVSRPHGMRLRYVLKRELLWDPCLDIVGNRLPNAFIDRFSNDSESEIRRTRELARDLGPRDGLLIHPEGTRFSEAKRRRVLERFQREGDAKMLEYARSLQYVLPPRPGGALGLLGAAPEADVVVCSHTGFESTASLAQIWQGLLVHQTVRIQFRRIPRDAIPSGRNDQLAWLLEEWRRVDAWVASHRTT